VFLGAALVITVRSKRPSPVTCRRRKTVRLQIREAEAYTKPINSKAEGKLLSHKQYNLEATFNARTFKSECKREELQISFKGQSIAILGIVDHKIVHKESDDDIVYDEMDDSILITSPAWRKTSNAACGMVVLA